MNEAKGSKELRERIRILERKLGVLDDFQTSCCSITLAQCNALVEIGRAENISLNELSGLLNIESSSMSRTVNNLVNNNLAKRDIDTIDRRYVTITLTESGNKLFKIIEESMDDYFAKIYNALPIDKREQVLDSLQILLAVIGENGCC